MKLVNDRTIGAWIPLPAPLEGLITRLGKLSRAPVFTAQRQMALSRALQSYLAAGNAPLAPLDQEVHLAELYVYADYYPEDGQLTLIEQLRDVITEHIPEEERQWLDPFKHSVCPCGIGRGPSGNVREPMLEGVLERHKSQLALIESSSASY